MSEQPAPNLNPLLLGITIVETIFVAGILLNDYVWRQEEKQQKCKC